MAEIDTLLRLVPDSPSAVLEHLQSNPTLASSADSSGYTLLHAAASYNQLPLLRALAAEYRASPNVTDSDGETPLFAAETEAVARCLVDELGADASIRNGDGISALENARTNADEDGGTWLEVVRYLEGKTGEGQRGTSGEEAGVSPQGADAHETRIPPPLPDGVRITGVRAVAEGEVGDVGEADPEFRRRIDELAAREDFDSDEGQRELRRLVEEAVGGIAEGQRDRELRQRTE